MNHLNLTDVQSTNLRLLYAIRLGLARDRAGTCRRFSLSAGQADGVSGLDPERILMLVLAVGEATLFVPRDDLLSLLDTPASLVGVLAAARSATAFERCAVR